MAEKKLIIRERKNPPEISRAIQNYWKERDDVTDYIPPKELQQWNQDDGRRVLGLGTHFNCYKGDCIPVPGRDGYTLDDLKQEEQQFQGFNEGYMNGYRQNSNQQPEYVYNSQYGYTAQVRKAQAYNDQYYGTGPYDNNNNYNQGFNNGYNNYYNQQPQYGYYNQFQQPQYGQYGGYYNNNGYYGYGMGMPQYGYGYGYQPQYQYNNIPNSVFGTANCPNYGMGFNPFNQAMVYNPDDYGFNRTAYLNGENYYISPEQMKKMQDNTMDILKRCSKFAIEQYTPDISEEEKEAIMTRFDPIKPEDLPENKYAFEDEMERLLLYTPPIDWLTPELEAICRIRTEVIAYNESHMPKDADLYYFLQNSQYLAVDARKREFYKNCKYNGLEGTYNRADYNQLIDMHSRHGSDYFFTSLSNANRASNNVDDLEIKLPEKFANSEAAKRREAFIAAILKK